MNFNSPLPRASQPRYHEGSPMRSIRDSDDNSRLWSKDRTVAKQGGNYGNAIQKIQRALARLERRLIGSSVPVLNKHPFQIYQPANFASFTTGVLFTSADGSGPMTCNIDATVPTDFSSSPPTVNPTTDAWRFWAVRSGEIELRPLYSINLVAASSNAALKYQVLTNSDGIAPLVTSFSAGQPSIANYDDPTNNTANPPLIIGPSGGGADGPGGYYQFAFWVKVTADTFTDPIAVEIQARDCSLIGQPFPESTPSLVPIGLITHSTLGAETLTIDQMVFDHICNRYPPGVGTFCSGSWMNFRGNWNKDTGDFDPLDLDQQVLYPGDCVFATWAPGGNPVSVMFQLSSNVPVVWQDPFLASVGIWKRVFEVHIQ